MREEEFDTMIKKQVQEQIKAPEELKNRIKTEIRNIEKKPKKNMKIVQGIAAVFTVAILGGITYAGVTGNLSLEKMGFVKASKNYDESAVDINKTISNDYADLTLKSIACDNSYIIAEYQISLKEKAIDEIGEIEYDEMYGYKMDINQNIKVNQKNANIMTTYVSKTGEDEYQYIVLINVVDEQEKTINFETEIIGINANDNVHTIVPNDENTIQINKKISLDIKRKDTSAQKFEKIERTKGNKTITVEDVANTNFDTFIKVKQTTKDITWKEYMENAYAYDSFIVEQETEENIPYSLYLIKENLYVTRDGKQININDLQDDIVEDDEKITIEEEYTINIGKIDQEGKNVKITPIQTKMYNDRTDEEEREYDNAQWHKIELNKKYTAKSDLGGTLEIESIDITENEIIFYYKIKGNIGNEQLVVMRNNNGKYNYACSAYEEREGLTGDENKIVFLRKEADRIGEYGYDMSQEEFDNILDDIPNLEFTMLFGSTNKRTGEPIDIQIPAMNKQIITVKNIEIRDLKLEDKDKELEYTKNEQSDFVDDEFTDLSGYLGEDEESEEEDYEDEEENSETIDGTQNADTQIIEKIESIKSNGTKMKKGETSINGIKLGMTREEIVKKIKSIKGDNVTIETTEDKESNRLIETYGNDINIEYIKENGEYKAVAIYSSGNNTKTDKGIKIGDRLEDIISKYAKNESSGYVDIKRDSDGSGQKYVLYGEKELQKLEKTKNLNKESNCAYVEIGNDEYMYVNYMAEGETLCIVLEKGKVIDIGLVYDEYVIDGE